MNWDSLFEMLKTVFANDPTMILLLTVGFFFLKQIWPVNTPASDQVLTGFMGRIRKALELGDAEQARKLADEGIAKTAEYLAKEAEPKPKGILDIFSTIFGSSTMMPLLLIGGVFLLLMITGGGGCKKANQDAPGIWPPAVNTGWSQPGQAGLGAVINEVRNCFYELDGPAGAVRTCAYQPGLPGNPWAWAGPEPGLPADCGGTAGPDAGDRLDLDGPGAAGVDQAGGAPVASCAAGLCRPRQPALFRARSVPRLAIQRGQPLRNAARLAARPLRWVGALGRGVARIFCRR